MLYTKDGFPEVNEIVIARVTKIYGNSTFVDLLEYEKEAILTISEIAPGRIRNLRDHVSENKEIILKVIRVVPKHNRIDVSLRRVPVPVMKTKQETLKKEDYAERMYIDIAKQLNITKDELFEKTYEPIFEDYETVFEALYTIMLENKKVEMFTKLNDNQKETFVNIINERIKPEEVIYKKVFNLNSMDENGVDLVKNSIDKSIKPLNYDKVKIIYLAAGEFEIKIIHDDMKSADMLFDKFKANLEEQSKTNNLQLKI